METLTDIFGKIPLQSILRAVGAIGGGLATSSATEKAIDAIPTSPPDVTTPWGTATFSPESNQITGEMSPELQELFSTTKALTEGIGPAPTTYEQDLALARGDFDTRKQRAYEEFRDEQIRQGRFGTEAGARELGELLRGFEQQEQRLQESVRDRRHRDRLELFGEALRGVQAQEGILGRPGEVIGIGTAASTQQLELAKQLAESELAKSQGINNAIDSLLAGALGEDDKGLFADTTLGDLFNIGSTATDLLKETVDAGKKLLPVVDLVKGIVPDVGAPGFGGGQGPARLAAAKAAMDAARGSALPGTTYPVVDTTALITGTELGTGVYPGFGSGRHPGGPGPAGLEAAKAAMDNYYPDAGSNFSTKGAGDAYDVVEAQGEDPGRVDPAKAVVKGIEQSLLNTFPVGPSLNASGLAAARAAAAAPTWMGNLVGAGPGGAGVTLTGGGTLAGTLGPAMAAMAVANLITGIQAKARMNLDDAISISSTYDTDRIQKLKAGKNLEPTGKPSERVIGGASVGKVPGLLRSLEFIGKVSPGEKAKAKAEGVPAELVNSANKVKRVEGPKGGYWYEVPESVEKYLENENPETLRKYEGLIRSSKTGKRVALPPPRTGRKTGGPR